MAPKCTRNFPDGLGLNVLKKKKNLGFLIDVGSGIFIRLCLVQQGKPGKSP